jgi:hypothetical protein
MFTLFVQDSPFDTKPSSGEQSIQHSLSSAGEQETFFNGRIAVDATKARKRKTSKTPQRKKDKRNYDRTSNQPHSVSTEHSRQLQHGQLQHPQVSIMQVVPLDSALLVRLRVVHANTAHHAQRPHRKRTHRNNTSLIELLQQMSASNDIITTNSSSNTELLSHSTHSIVLDPGSKLFPIHVDARHNKRLVYDVTIHNLTSGIDYHVSVRANEANHTATQEKSAASRTSSHVPKQRVMTARPGCYNPHIHPQCCGHGECATVVDVNADKMHFFFGLSSTADAKCVCDAGYSGAYCDYYMVQQHDDKGVAMLSNVSNAANMCPPMHLRHDNSVNITLFSKR